MAEPDIKKKSKPTTVANRLGSLLKVQATPQRKAEAYIPIPFQAGRLAKTLAQTSVQAARQPASSYSSGGYSSGGSGGSANYGSGGSRSYSTSSGGGGGAAYVAPVVDTYMTHGPYAPKYLMSAADLFAEDPGIMLQDLAQRYAGADGLGDNAIIAQLQPYMDLMNPLFMASQGSNDAVASNKEAWVNWLGAQIDAMMTPGQYMDVGTAVRNVLNPAAGSLLQNFQATGDASDMAKNTSALLSAAAAMGLHPGFQRTVRDRLDQVQQAYLAASAKGPVDPFYKYLQATVPDLARLLPGAGG